MGVSKSGDRLGRVQEMSKFLTKPNPGQAADSTDILSVRDILARHPGSRFVEWIYTIYEFA